MVKEEEEEGGGGRAEEPAEMDGMKECEENLFASGITAQAFPRSFPKTSPGKSFKLTAKIKKELKNRMLESCQCR